MKYSGNAKNWLKFLFGLIMLIAFAGVLASGFTPPGICGEVLRHNQDYDIDASPFWYGDVENMQEYEAGVKEMRELANTVDKNETEVTVIEPEKSE